MKLRATFTKVGYIKYISHLDLVRLFQRAFNRAKIPVLYSEGFNPHQKFSIGNPLSLGVESEREYLDVEVDGNYNIDKFLEDINNNLPKGVSVTSVTDDFEDVAISNLIEFTTYEFTFTDLNISTDQIQGEIDSFLELNSIEVERQKKKGKKKIIVSDNIREKIISLTLSAKDNYTLITGTFTSGELNNLRPDSFIEALKRYTKLNFDADLVAVKRIENFNSSMDRI